jgi:sec-independent protein translocase protein TatC
MRHDLLPAGATLIAGGLTDTLYVYMFLSLLIGIVVSSPIVGYELYAFLASALYPWERRNISRFVASFFGLFAFGVGMAYFLILPLTFKILVWFISSGGAAPFINIQDFYNMIITLILATGAFYTAPIFVILLVHVRILPSAFIAGKRKIMYLAFLVILTIITPDPTPLTAIIIMIPFMVIFEAAVLAARRVEKQKVAT